MATIHIISNDHLYQNFSLEAFGYYGDFLSHKIFVTYLLWNKIGHLDNMTGITDGFI